MVQPRLLTVRREMRSTRDKRPSRPSRLSQALAIAAESLMDNVGEIQEGAMISPKQHCGAAVTLVEIDWCLCLKLPTETGPSCEVPPTR